MMEPILAFLLWDTGTERQVGLALPLGSFHLTALGSPNKLLRCWKYVGNISYTHPVIKFLCSILVVFL